MNRLAFGSMERGDVMVVIAARGARLLRPLLGHERTLPESASMAPGRAKRRNWRRSLPLDLRSVGNSSAGVSSQAWFQRGCVSPERGIEPLSPVYKTGALPLSYSGRRGERPGLRPNELRRQLPTAQVTSATTAAAAAARGDSAFRHLATTRTVVVKTPCSSGRDRSVDWHRSADTIGETRPRRGAGRLTLGT